MDPPKNKPVRLHGAAMQKLNSAIHERDNYSCIVCGRYVEEDIKFHHYPFGSGNKSDEIEKGVTLCLNCHSKAHSQKRIAPMIRTCPALRRKVKDARKRDSENKVLSKAFPGGFLLITGANSASALRSNPIKNLMLDEIDAYPADVDGEGDPIELSCGRTQAFADCCKIFKLSAPIIKGHSHTDAPRRRIKSRR